MIGPWQWATSRLRMLRLPWWLSFLVGLVLVAVGAVLTVRPFTSLSVLIVLVAGTAFVTGITDLAFASEQDSPALARLAGVAWLVVSVGVAVWPGLSLDVLTIWVGVGLLLGGVTRAVGGVRGVADQRVTAVFTGLASVVFGILALSWPDVTILVVAVVFGARTVLAGLVLLTTAFRRAPTTAPPATGPGWLRRWSTTLRAAIGLIVAVALLAVSAILHERSPSADAFY